MHPLAQINKLTLDQLLLLVTVSEAGSFSAAAHQLDRVQSTISHGIASLESELGIKLFDRSRRKPVLTPAGLHLLPQARQILTHVRHFQSDAQSLAQGQESSVAIVLDMIIPLEVIPQSLQALQTQYPAVQWLIHTEMLSAISQRIIEGSSQIGFTGMLPRIKKNLVSEVIGKVDFVYVVSHQHALAQASARVTRHALESYTQLGVADRAVSDLGQIQTDRSWQFADLSMLLGFVLAAQGWAFLPLHLVWADLQSGRLQILWPQDKAEIRTEFPIHSIRLESERPGPVRQQLIQAFRQQFKAHDRQTPNQKTLMQVLKQEHSI